ncbi:restriction endonuclease subunit S, partial [Listeria grayi]
IALHQRKLELLKQLKQGFLQQMFVRDGEKKPVLRFAGFESGWEQRTLGEITNRFDNLRIPVTASDRIAGTTPYYGANGIQDYVEGFTHKGEYVLVAEDGANDLINYPVQYVNEKIWVNNHVHVIQGIDRVSDNKFLMNAIKSINIEPFLVGGGRAKLTSNILMKLPVKAPAFLEQQKIGTFFQQLDNILALQQSKIDKLTTLKKGYLKNLFV